MCLTVEQFMILQDKAKLAEYGAKYRKINQKKLSTITMCPCGGQFTYQNRSTHFKQVGHQKYLKRTGNK